MYVSEIQSLGSRSWPYQIFPLLGTYFCKLAQLWFGI